MLVTIYDGNDKHQIHVRYIKTIVITIMTTIEPVKTIRHYFDFIQSVLQTFDESVTPIRRCEIAHRTPGFENIVLPKVFSFGIKQNKENDVIFILYVQLLNMMLVKDKQPIENLQNTQLSWEIITKKGSESKVIKWKSNQLTT